MSRPLPLRLAACIAIAASTAVVVWRWLPEPNPPNDLTEAVVEASLPNELMLPKAGFTALPVRAGQFVPFSCEPAFGDLKFWDPLFVAPFPDGSGRLAIVERRGTIQLVDQRDGRVPKQPLLEIVSRIFRSPDRAEEGLLGLAFHPRFADKSSPHRGEFFVAYVGRGATEGASTNRLSRFRMKPGLLDEVDHESEEILIDQPQYFQAHNGGSVVFGPDGFLYYSVGDDAYTPPNPNPQSITRNLFSGILRLDVDCQGGAISHTPPRQPLEGHTAGYFIPKDNPFVGKPNVLEEFYSLGLRNPWRIAFDRDTGLLYASDVGSRRREEINLIDKGSNCCWNYAEGTLRTKDVDPAMLPAEPSGIGIETWPLFEYSRDAAHRCIIGGYVYRGKKFPELVGRYIFADQSGRIYALELKENGRRAGANQLIAVLPEPGIGISSLGEDAAGELYFCSIGELATETGRVFRLRRNAEIERDHLPQTLVETNLFADWSKLEPQPWLIPFDVKVPFWSDGAEKRRWIALPPDEHVATDPHGQFRFPQGTVFVKHFDLRTDVRAGVNAPPRRLETRILVCNDDGGSYGATYRWSVDQREARLVTFNETEEISITLADGTHVKQTWTYPGRFECALCHNDASGHVLGFKLRQLDLTSPAEHEGQIAKLIASKVLSKDATAVPDAVRGKLFVLDDAAASLEQRVRSYLDVNCSSCHNPNTRFAAFDTRIDRDIGEQGLVDGMTYHHTELGDDVRVVRPGDLKLSMLHNRMASDDPSVRMPPLGSHVVDRNAAELVAAWINSFPPPQYPPQPAQPPAIATPVDGVREKPPEKTASDKNTSPQ